eukprot:TRINITY_DN64735_c0_g1_i1.p1 TRINITY_DN64735_c0_g1~~TRINITY_DN64735_c0_g1_i1.p1  ORF type:complete len:314 (-),score=53.53 TRINITY_DN64735_c0_g1_i1:79-999(-)
MASFAVQPSSWLPHVSLQHVGSLEVTKCPPVQIHLALPGAPTKLADMSKQMQSLELLTTDIEGLTERLKVVNGSICSSQHVQFLRRLDAVTDHLAQLTEQLSKVSACGVSQGGQPLQVEPSLTEVQEKLSAMTASLPRAKTMPAILHEALPTTESSSSETCEAYSETESSFSEQEAVSKQDVLVKPIREGIYLMTASRTSPELPRVASTPDSLCNGQEHDGGSRIPSKRKSLQIQSLKIDLLDGEPRSPKGVMSAKVWGNPESKAGDKPAPLSPNSFKKSISDKLADLLTGSKHGRKRSATRFRTG